MKLLLVLNLLLCVAFGFVMPGRRNDSGHTKMVLSISSVRPQSSSLASDFASDFGSAMPEEVSPYERMGIQENQLALGINPEEVLSFAGT